MGVLWQLLSASTPFLLCGIAVLILQQQLSYLKKKGPLPGPTLIIPFLGSAISMVSRPVRFWERQAAMAASSGLGFSANFIAGRFVIFLRSSELSHHVFANVRPDAFHLIGHPFGKKLFGERNMIYLFDEEHKELRRSIAPNFAPRALSAYLQIQQRVILRHLRSWIEIADSRKSAVPLRLLCRDLNLDTSQTVFVGPYLSAGARERFNSDYGIFNRGLLAFPLDLPGFTFRRARLAAGRLAEELAVCVGRSKARMRAGEEPGCLVDFWMSEAVRESPEKDSDGEIASHVFDFLFAAQDASTSSLLWAIALLESHPDVLKRVRREVGSLWSPESGELIGTEAVREMKYTEAVVREVIRIRPPATLVPHVAGEDFRLTEWYTVPKGAIVFPSVFESSFQGFPEPDRFDPDRFLGERQEDRVYKRNYLAFGAGPHQCVGQRYAVNHLVIFIALFVSLIDFRRRRTDGCDEIAYVPTIVPKDDCTVYLTRRRPGFSFPPF